MNRGSFKKLASAVTLFSFLATPTAAFALTAEQPSPIGTPLAFPRQPYYGQQPYYGGGQQGGVGNVLGQLGFLSLLSGGLGGLGGQQGGSNQLLSGLAVGSLLGGGGFGGGFGGGGGGGAAGAAGQFLSMAGALTGNMGLLIAGMITSMIGGFTGGGSTPQQSAIDEQYVAPGQAGPYGAGYGAGYGNNSAYSPYYESPTSTSTVSSAISQCRSMFIVDEDGAGSAPAKMYPTSLSISAASSGSCITVLNTDKTKAHAVRFTKDGQEDELKFNPTIDAGRSYIFRLPEEHVLVYPYPAQKYSLCVTESNSCAAITVQ